VLIALHTTEAPRPPASSTALAAAQPVGRGVEVLRGGGAWIETTDGRRLLDLTSGMATLNLGHGHPAVIHAVERQLRELLHAGGAYTHRPLGALAERLADIAPGEIGSFLFATSGSEAVEAGVRLARAATGRPGVVVFRGGYHGRTLGAASCTTSRAVLHPAGLVAGTAVAPFPRPWEWGLDTESAAEVALAGLDEVHRHELRPEDTACYLVEPVQGAGGCHPARRRFLRGLRERADRHGALLVFDEVQTGLGRTGAWFAADTYEVAPDVICLAKALGGGLPLSAVGASPELMACCPAGAHGSTFGGSPLACAAALAALEVAAGGDLPGRARRLGAVARRRLRGLAARTPELVDVRGEGLMLGLEFGGPSSRRPYGALADAVARALDAEDVLALCSGPEGSVVRFIPPLVITDEELDLGLAAIEQAVEAVCQTARSTEPPLALVA
jgi:4-aminobutyrate aminotransferase